MNSIFRMQYRLLKKKQIVVIYKLIGMYRKNLLHLRYTMILQAAITDKPYHFVIHRKW